MAILGSVGSLKTLTVNLGALHENIKSAGAWKASKAYNLNDIIYPTSGNGCQYQCTTAGTSGATQPTWATTIGGTVTDGTAVWTCQALTFNVPTANPGNAGAQISYTIQQSDMPTFSGVTPISYITVGNLWIGGFNAGSANAALNFQVFKNGTSLMTSSTNTVAGNTYATELNGAGTLAVGDVITVAIWGPANMYWDYWALQLFPSKVQVSDLNALIKDATYVVNKPTLAILNGANPNYEAAFYVYPATNGNIYINFPHGTWTFPYIEWWNYCGRVAYGDIYAVSSYGSTASSTAANRPAPVCPYLSQLSFREVMLR